MSLRVNCRKYSVNLCVWIAIFLVGGCYVGPNMGLIDHLSDDEKPAYKLYPGKERPLSQLAIVELTDVHFAQINGLKVNRADYDQVLLLPGEHVIAWGRSFMVSVMVDSDMSAEGMDIAKPTLKAGHTYELRADRTTGHNYQLYFWIRDSSTGEIVSGVQKP